MVSKSKLVLLTSTSFRHKYIANQLAKCFNLALVITEEKSSKIESLDNLNNEESIFLNNHFKNRLLNEQKYFGDNLDFNKDINVVKVPHKSINSIETFKRIKKVNPDRIILFGTSIIKEPILSFFKGNIINLHLGLSPYYKGSATNLFPIKYNELDCIGATIHIATPKVDQGPILHQLRPDINGDEKIHDLGNKVILKSGIILPLVIRKNIDGEINGKTQIGKGRICKISDLNINVLKDVYKKIELGIVSDFLKNKKRTLKPIIEVDL